MSDSILVSKDNAVSILTALFSDLKTKINNKDISLPYTTEFTKGSVLKIDGLGDMYLSNNGNYIKIGTITQDQLDINKIYQIFSIVQHLEKWDNTGITKIPINKYYFGCVQYNGKIYCIGGLVNGNGASSVNIYDITSNTWTTGTSVPVVTYQFGCVQYNGKIYCIGGCNNKVLIYDIASNTWSSGANMITPRSLFSAVLYGSQIYCLGGRYYTTIEVYDIPTNTWSSKGDMPVVRCDFGCVQYNGKIYCIGGYEQNGYLNMVDIYDIQSGIWSTGLNIPTALASFGYVLSDGKVYCIGGYNGTTGINTTHVYNISINTWSTISNLPTNNMYFGSILYNSKIYCISGAWSTDTQVLQLPYTSYNVPLPSSINTKLNKLIANGAGNKIFSNDGTYKSITPSYTVMTSDEIALSLNAITSV